MCCTQIYNINKTYYEDNERLLTINGCGPQRPRNVNISFHLTTTRNRLYDVKFGLRQNQKHDNKDG